MDHLVVATGINDVVQLSVWWPAGPPYGKDDMQVADGLAREWVTVP